MSLYYDRQGQPIDRAEWRRRFERERVLEQDTLGNGRFVSTVWLGIAHGHDAEGGALVFETMVFPSQGVARELAVERYSTEQAARIGHAEMVAAWGTPVGEAP